jgi:ribosomal protein L11 methyltransferase
MYVRASTRRKASAPSRPADSGGSWKLTLPCTRAEAEAINGDTPEFATMASTPVIITREPDEHKPHLWQLDAYFEGRPDDASVAFIQSLIPSAKRARPIIEKLPDADWVTVSQAGLEPVHAGRFYVQTSTSSAAPPEGTKRFIIDASLAFGTGGHATTTGCLAMLDALKRSGARFDHIVDIGTGTGLLAFTANHLWPRAYVTASDIDPVSVDVAADNARVNGVTLGQQPGRVALCAASGTDHEMIQRRAPYDLIIANILAGPLIELAPAFAAIARDGATLILAGLLSTQKEAVAKAYRSYGFRLAESNGEGDWPCLRLVKRASLGWKRPVRTNGRTSQPEGDFGTW